MLWLAVTLLKSASSRFDAQVFLQTPMPEPYSECNQLGVSNTMFGLVEWSSKKQEGAFHVETILVPVVDHPKVSVSAGASSAVKSWPRVNSICCSER
ncbi:hypothetical protein KY284_009456 [Solanum tuberosum]|nr:hypothetical protein KY284_009456 [Solanum tuberosum]